MSADSDRFHQQELSSLPLPTKKTRHLSEVKQQPVSSLPRQVPSSAIPLAIKDRRTSNPNALLSSDDHPAAQVFKGRKLPPTPTVAGALERPSTVRSRTESAPDPLPPPFQPKLAAHKDHYYANLILHTPPDSPVDYGHLQICDSTIDDHRHSFGPSKRKGQLDPLVPRTYTSAREMSPVSAREPGNLRRNKVQIVPQSRNELMENGGTPTIGWGSNKNLVTSRRHSGSHQSVFGMSTKSDIQSLMDSPMNYQMQSVERLNTLGTTSPTHSTGLAWSSGHNMKGLDFRQQESSPSVSPFHHPKQKLLTSKDSPKLNNESFRNELSPVDNTAQSFKRTRSASAKARPHTVHVTQPLQSKATKSTKNLSFCNGEQLPNNYRRSEYYDYYNTSTEQLPEIDTRTGSGKVLLC